MSDDQSAEDPPEETEAYEQYDEVSDYDDEDPGATGVTGAERDLSRFSEIPVDARENEEIGADLDDPEQMAMLDGGMDDPDGIDPDQVRQVPSPDEEGWG